MQRFDNSHFPGWRKLFRRQNLIRKGFEHVASDWLQNFEVQWPNCQNLCIKIYNTSNGQLVGYVNHDQLVIEKAAMFGFMSRNRNNLFVEEMPSSRPSCTDFPFMPNG